MIGLDTNILVRLLVEDDMHQAGAARRYLETHCSVDSPGYVTNIALVELAWVLEKVLKLPRMRLAHSIETLLTANALLLENADIVRQALEYYRDHNADFADAMIGLLSEAKGTDYTVTFDRSAAQLPEFKLLQA